ncbi:MAG: hypothetical protein JXA67_06480 [Micromonosporaceae bacterium]|nr:hypothetical protein [Micromonosporaceae bacterium]
MRRTTLRTVALASWLLLSIWALGFSLGLGLPRWVVLLVALAGVSLPLVRLVRRAWRAALGLVALIRGVSREEITPRRTSRAWRPAMKWSTR